ncbi:MAG: prolyl oligopeptidase family serine peptidase [Planctomycetes bacterium]|nr:prolyl oligopeptidase family serine peptidase [Planctomycetota bacterium]
MRVLHALAWASLLACAAAAQQMSLTPTVLDCHPTLAEFRDEIARADIVVRARIERILRRRDGSLGDEDVIIRPLRIHKGSFASERPCVRIEFYQSREYRPGARLPDVGEEVILPLDIVHPYTGAAPLEGEKVHTFAKFFYAVAPDGSIGSIFGFPQEMRPYLRLSAFEELIAEAVARPAAPAPAYEPAEVLFFDDFDDGSLAGWAFLEGERGFLGERLHHWDDETWVGPGSLLRNLPPSGRESPPSWVRYDPDEHVWRGERNGTPIEIGVFDGRLRMRGGLYWLHIIAVAGDPEWTDYELDLDVYTFDDHRLEGRADLGQVNYLKFGPYGRLAVPNLPETHGEHSMVAVEFGTFGNYDVSEMTFGNNAFQIRCKYPEAPLVWRDHSVLLRTTRILDYEPWPIPRATRIHMTAVYFGRHVEGWIDGRKVLEGEIPEDHPGAARGRIGLWTFETWAEFDNVKVTRLVAAAPPPPAAPNALPSARALARDLPCRAEFLEIEGRPAFLYLPETVRRRPIPWVWYAPTLPGHPDPSHAWMFRQFLARGIAIAGIDVGESYGNPGGRAVYAAFSRFLEAKRDLSGKAILLPQSRGGLMLYNWAVEDPRRVAAIAGIYTVCDLRSWPGLEKACGAYGMDEATLAAHLAAHNPVDRLKPLADARVPILHIHGDSDSVVPIEKNAGEVVRRIRDLGGSAQLIVVPGKGHEVVPQFFRSQAFADFILRAAEGPIARWTFDSDHEGDRALDASGNGNHGILVRDPRRVPGVFGSAIAFDGNGQAIRVPHADALKPRDAISFSAWVSPSNLGGVHHIYRKEDGDDRHLFAFQNAGTVLSMGLNFDGAYRELDAPIAPDDFPPGTWHHVAATFDGSTARMYVDGGEIASMAAPGPIGTAGIAPGFIGADKGTESFFAGAIDDVRIYGRALAAEEVRALFEEAPEAIRRAAEEARAAREAREAARRGSLREEVLRPIDLAERAAHAMRGYLSQGPERLPGPEGPDQPYCRTHFSCALLPRPVLAHGRWDCGDLTSRGILAWIAAREMTGDRTTGREIEEGQRRFLLSMLDAKTGLAFVPEISDPGKGTFQFHSWDQSRALRALCRWYETTPGDRTRIRPLIDRMIDGLDRFSDIRGDDPAWGPYACWSADEFDQDRRPVEHPFDRNAYPDIGELIPDPAGSSIEGLAMWARVAGDEKALDLAIRFTNGELGRHRADKWPPDQRRFSGFEPDGAFAGHFHSKTTTLIGIAKLGRLLLERGRREEGLRFLRAARRSYDWIFAADNPGRGSRIGWFRERPRVSSAEICSTGDMVELAEALAACATLDPALGGWADLHDDVESMTLNMIARSQIRLTPQFRAFLAARYGADAEAALAIARRLDGAWPTTPLPNDLVAGSSIPMSGCCQYAGLRGLYAGWRDAMASAGGELRINNFVARRSPQAEMTTAMPAKGEVEIVLRAEADVFIRVPRWLRAEAMELTVNAAGIRAADRLDAMGRYVALGHLAGGDRVQVRFPLEETVTEERIGNMTYRIRWRGNTVVRVDPPGREWPLFP